MSYDKIDNVLLVNDDFNDSVIIQLEDIQSEPAPELNQDVMNLIAQHVSYKHGLFAFRQTTKKNNELVENTASGLLARKAHDFMMCDVNYWLEINNSFAVNNWDNLFVSSVVAGLVGGAMGGIAGGLTSGLIGIGLGCGINLTIFVISVLIEFIDNNQRKISNEVGNIRKKLFEPYL